MCAVCWNPSNGEELETIIAGQGYCQPLEATMPNPKSTAQIAGHPIHPMLIPFPIACFVLTLISDLAFWRTSNDFWANASLWLLGIGLIMAALAAVMGLTDVLGDVQIRNLSDAWLHAGGNVVAVVIQLYNWYSRYEHGSSAIIPTGLILSLVIVLILLFTGWKGWEMVYRYRVGVADQPAEAAARVSEYPEDARRRAG
jgi:uncharacterized membrane protein